MGQVEVVSITRSLMCRMSQRLECCTKRWTYDDVLGSREDGSDDKQGKENWLDEHVVD